MLWGTDAMISRAGKFTEEIHMILQHKDEILSQSPKKQMRQSQSSFKLEQLQEKDKEDKLLKQINIFHQDNIKDPKKDKTLVKSQSQKDRIGSVIQGMNSTQTTNNSSKNSWAFGTISREHYYNVKKLKHPNPPCGAYSLNFKQVDRKFKPLSWTSAKNETRVIKEKVEPDMRLIELKKDDIGFLDFDRFKKREEFYRSQGTVPHDKRFEPFNYFPNVSTKAIKYNVINFQSTLPRDDKQHQVNLTPSTYNVNFEVSMPKISKALLPFNRMLARKPNENINRAHTNDSVIYDNIDKYYQKYSKYKKVVLTDLSKGFSRGDSTQEGLLPSFMAKTLEQNHFSDGQFLTMISSFDPKKSFRATQSTFGSPKKLNLTGSTFNPRLITLGQYDEMSQTKSKQKRNSSQEEGLTYNQVLAKTGFLKNSQSEIKLDL